jgi:hypothetical protein
MFIIIALSSASRTEQLLNKHLLRSEMNKLKIKALVLPKAVPEDRELDGSS